MKTKLLSLALCLVASLSFSQATDEIFPIGLDVNDQQRDAVTRYDLLATDADIVSMDARVDSIEAAQPSYLVNATVTAGANIALTKTAPNLLTIAATGVVTAEADTLETVANRGNVSTVDIFAPRFHGLLNNNEASEVYLSDSGSLQDWGKILTDHITDGTILNADIAAGAAIDDSKLATIDDAGKVSDSALSANVSLLGQTIESAEITNGTIASIDIEDLTIVNGDISASAGIVDTKLATISTAGKVSDSALSANVSLLGQTISSSEIVDETIVSADIFNGTIASIDIADGTIVNADVSASAAIVDTKLATIATAGKVSDSALSANIPRLDAASQTFAGNMDIGGFVNISNGLQVFASIAADGDISAAADFFGSSAYLAGALTQQGSMISINSNYANVGPYGFNIGDSSANNHFFLYDENYGLWTAGYIDGPGLESFRAYNITADGTFYGSAAGLTGVPDAALSANVSLLGQTIESAEITNETIVSADIFNGTVASIDIADNSVATGDILDLTILNTDISASAAIVDTKLATISTAGKVSDSALSSNVALRNNANNFSVEQVMNSARMTNSIRHINTAGTLLDLNLNNFVNSNADQIIRVGRETITGTGALQTIFYVGDNSSSNLVGINHKTGLLYSGPMAPTAFSSGYSLSMAQTAASQTCYAQWDTVSGSPMYAGSIGVANNQFTGTAAGDGFWLVPSGNEIFLGDNSAGTAIVRVDGAVDGVGINKAAASGYDLDTNGIARIGGELRINGATATINHDQTAGTTGLTIYSGSSAAQLQYTGFDTLYLSQPYFQAGFEGGFQIEDGPGFTQRIDWDGGTNKWQLVYEDGGDQYSGLDMGQLFADSAHIGAHSAPSGGAEFQVTGNAYVTHSLGVGANAGTHGFIAYIPSQNLQTGQFFYEGIDSENKTANDVEITRKIYPDGGGGSNEGSLLRIFNDTEPGSVDDVVGLEIKAQFPTGDAIAYHNADAGFGNYLFRVGPYGEVISQTGFTGPGSTLTNLPSWSPIVTKYTISETALTAAATTQLITVTSLASNQKILGVTVKHSTLFSGPGITDVKIQVGDSAGALNEYTSPFDIDTAVSGTAKQDTNLYKSTTHSGSTVQAEFNSSGANVNAMTAGSVDIWITTVYLP